MTDLLAHLPSLTKTACSAATRAAVFIMERRGQHGAVMTKDSNGLAASVFTEVDQEAQRMVVEALMPSCDNLGLGLLAEETPDDGSRLKAPAFWCIDPLDGTLPFIEGREGFAVSIALISQNGTPLIGVAVDPVGEVLYYAYAGGGAWRWPQSQAEPQPFLQEESNKHLTFFTDRSFTKHPDYEAVVEALRPVARELGYEGVDAGYRGGGVLHAIWLLERGPGCYFKFPKSEPGGGSIWDFAATACIYRELAVPVRAMDGSILPLNHPETTYMHHCGISYATNERIADAVTQLYHDFASR